MKDKFMEKYNIKTLIVCIILTILIFFYLLLVLYNFHKVKSFDSKVLPNSYLQNYSIGGYSFKTLEEFVFFVDENLNKKNISFVANGKEYKYKYNDVGLVIDFEKLKEEIINYQNSLSYGKKVALINNKDKKIYDYVFKYDENKLKKFFEDLEKEVNCNKVDGHFSVESGSVSYIKGADGFSLNKTESLKKVKELVSTGIKDDTKVELVGNVISSSNNPNYEKVNSLVSTFTTNFDRYVYARATNLYTALNYINGAIIEPGEVFSYYKYAGPYNKKGYVFYYEFVGNGVCQIATTVYNAALLGGLEIVKRYPHAAKSVYVAGGLDATVASYSSGWNVDFQFKNTYDYPIYIRAYADNGKATVEFWSNSDAKKGYTYSTESVQIGYRGYKSYLHVFKDGAEVEKRFIATTWYSKD